jgi:hypothetical protein
LNFPTPQELERKLITIQQLMDHPGWKLFIAAMDSSLNQAYNQMILAKDPTSQSKHLGAYHTLLSLKEWPEREGKMIQQHLQNDPRSFK